MHISYGVFQFKYILHGLKYEDDHDINKIFCATAIKHKVKISFDKPSHKKCTTNAYFLYCDGQRICFMFCAPQQMHHLLCVCNMSYIYRKSNIFFVTAAISSFFTQQQ